MDDAGTGCRKVMVLGGIACLVAIGGCAPTQQTLFDGRTFAGWTKRGGNAQFTIEDECIVGTTRPDQPNTFLCTIGTYRNFILELEFKVDPELNSGVQIRSEARPDYRAGVVHGYQVEIDPSPRAWTGGIFDESRRGWLAPLDGKPEAQAAFVQGEWNRLRVEAKGDRMQTWVNDVPAADLHDDMTRSGFIALQVHGVGPRKEPLSVRFRKIQLTRLD